MKKAGLGMLVGLVLCMVIVIGSAAGSGQSAAATCDPEHNAAPVSMRAAGQPVQPATPLSKARLNPNNPAPTANPNDPDVLTPLEVARVAHREGFQGDDLVMAVAVAGAESTYNRKATHLNPNGSTDYGLWQINSVHADLLATGDWQNPSDNARFAHEIFLAAGSSWQDWVTFNDDLVVPFMDTARQAVADLKASGVDPGTATAPTVTPAPRLAVPLDTGIGCQTKTSTSVDTTVFDPGNVISDEVFYNVNAMDLAAVRTHIQEGGKNCNVAACLKNMHFPNGGFLKGDYCAGAVGGTNDDAADVIYKASVACGINPQVMLTTLNKESGLITRTDPTLTTYDAAFGWHCPDTGPGGTANCDPAHKGFVNQAYGMAVQWAKYRKEIPKNDGQYNYGIGTYNILWNVKESGCGGAPVTIVNVATASLYVYTPYQPNAASLASYPGTGDACSAYGIRNFYRYFLDHFGSTGGGRTTTVAIEQGGHGVVPSTINPTITAVLQRATNMIGLPYCWGGGDQNGPTPGDPDAPSGGTPGPNGLSPGCSAATPGFDCSGLTLYAWAGAGISLAHYTKTQYTQGQQFPVAQVQPGDLIFWSTTGSVSGIHHVAMYYSPGKIIEAQQDNVPVHIRDWSPTERQIMPFVVRLG